MPGLAMGLIVAGIEAFGRMQATVKNNGGQVFPPGIPVPGGLYMVVFFEEEQNGMAFLKSGREAYEAAAKKK